MSRYLIDTCTFIWWLEDSPRLSRTAISILDSDASEVFLSLVSPWEMTIKHARGRLPNLAAYMDKLDELVTVGVVDLMSPTPKDVAALKHLTPHHHDPFDLMLVAQAQIAGLPILSPDDVLFQYGVPVIW